jgi:two-component system chemotaxis response regulator CheY
MSRTLLITDDSMIIREMIKEIALENGWQVVGEATDGQQAIDAFAKLRPDVVTMDLVMPDFDGLHGLRGIRVIDPSARVLIVSAIDQKEIVDELLRLGAAEIIVKPFNRNLLQRALQALFDRATVGSTPRATHMLAGCSG